MVPRHSMCKEYRRFGSNLRYIVLGVAFDTIMSLIKTTSIPFRSPSKAFDHRSKDAQVVLALNPSQGVLSTQTTLVAGAKSGFNILAWQQTLPMTHPVKVLVSKSLACRARSARVIGVVTFVNEKQVDHIR